MSTLLLEPRVVVVDGGGTPLAGAKRYVYATGTTTPLTVYADAALTTPHAAPQVADANGVFAPAYLAGTVTSYRRQLKTSADVLLSDVDAISTNAMTQAEIGATLYPRTTTEQSAGVTPTSYVYPPGDVRRYGADPTGVLSSTTAANDCALANSAVYFPAGTYLLSTAFNVPANRTVYGDGIATVIKFINNNLAVNNAANVTLRDFKVIGNGTTPPQPIVTLSNNFKAVRIYADANLSSGAPSTYYFFNIQGCVDAQFLSCTFINFQTGVFLDKSGATNSDRVLVHGCHFEFTAVVNNLATYPTGVYQYYCDHLVVDGCTFKNILPGAGLADANRIGYAVYEGDGAAVSLTVVNCVGINTLDGAHSFALAYAAKYVNLSNNTFIGNSGQDAFFYRGDGTGSVLIHGNHIADARIIVAGGVNSELATISQNYMVYTSGSTQQALRIGSVGAVRQAKVLHNTLIRPGGGIFVSACSEHALIDGNTIRDCNTSNQSFDSDNVFTGTPIAFQGALFGCVTRNHVSNTKAGGGRAKYAFAQVYDASHNIDVRPDNVWLAMDTGSVYRGITSSKRPGVNPFWGVGQAVWYTDPSASNAPGEVCVAAVKQTLGAAAASGAGTVTLISATGVSSGDYIAVQLDTGAWHATTVNGAPAGAVVTLTATLPSAAAAGNFVVTNRFKTMAALGA